MLTLWHSSEKLHELIEMLFVTRNTFYGTRYLSHCSTGFVLNPLFVNWVTSLNLGSLEVIGHVTIGTADGPFLLVCWRQVTISHGCRDIEHQTFQGHHLDPFGSRDVIGHVTIGSTGGPFLLVIRWHNVPLSCTVAKILSLKHFGVTTLTLLGHVMSSVTWPLEPQMVISCWSSIDTMSLSPTVAEILSIIIWITIFPL